MLSHVSANAYPGRVTRPRDRGKWALGNKEAEIYFDKIMPYLYTNKFSEMSEASDSNIPSQMKAQRINIIIPTESVGNNTHTQETLYLNPFSLFSRKLK